MRKDRKKHSPSSCDRQAARGGEPSLRHRRMRLHRHRPDFTWTGVKTERYKDADGTWSSVLRRTLIGGKAERTAFHVRYFEVAPGGHTTLEQHRHEHVVLCMRGRGECVVGRRKHGLSPLDVLYVPPFAAHQLRNPHGEPFGFLCIVDAERDRPRPL
ncbi:MAG: cupin domain-containing protein [Nitrospirota bacterium]